jgi:hypothetical protein
MILYSTNSYTYIYLPASFMRKSWIHARDQVMIRKENRKNYTKRLYNEEKLLITYHSCQRLAYIQTENKLIYSPKKRD